MRCAVYVRSTMTRARQANKSKPVSVTRISSIQSSDNVTVVDNKQTSKQQQQQQQQRVMVHKPVKSEVVVKKAGQRSTGGRHLQPPSGNNSKLKHECPFDGCPWRFATPYKLRRHIKSHTKETPYQCKECGRGFSVRYNLLMHVQTIHSTPHKYKCPMAGCKDAFHTQPRLNGHLRKIHKKDWKQIQMEQTSDGASIDSPTDVTMPSSTDKASKWYKCINCTKEFTSQAKLSAHMRTHSGSFPCTVQGCSKSFQTSDKLSKHLDTSHKSIPCPHRGCTRVFLKQSQLKNHIKVHNSKYNCPKQECNLKFDNETDYNDHLNVHKGYCIPCPFKHCNLTFPTQKRLELHYKVAHLIHNGGDTDTTDMLLTQLSSQTNGNNEENKTAFSDCDDFMDSIELPDLKVEDVEAVMLEHTNWTGDQIDTFLKSLEMEELDCASSLKSSLSGYESDSGYSTHEVSPMGRVTHYSSALSPAITPVTPSTILSSSSSSTSPVPFCLYHDDIFHTMPPQSTTPTAVSNNNTTTGTDHYFFGGSDLTLPHVSTSDTISTLCHTSQLPPSQQPFVALNQSSKGCVQSVPPPISNVSDIEANRHSVTVVPNSFCNTTTLSSISQQQPQFDNFLDGYLNMLNTDDHEKQQSCQTGNKNPNIDNSETVDARKRLLFDEGDYFDGIESSQTSNCDSSDEYTRQLSCCAELNKSNNNNELAGRIEGGRLVIAQVVNTPPKQINYHSNNCRLSNKAKGKGRHHSVTVTMKGHQRGKKKSNWPKSMNSGNLIAFRNYILGKLKHNPAISQYAAPSERLIDIQQQQSSSHHAVSTPSMFYSVPNSDDIFNDIGFNPDTLLTCERSSVDSSCFSPFSHHSGSISPSPVPMSPSPVPMSPNLESSIHFTSLSSLSSVPSPCTASGHLDIDGFIQCLSVDSIQAQGGLDQPVRMSPDFCNILKTDADPLLGGLS